MVYVMLAKGFEEIEALTPVDLLRRAGVEVMTVAIGEDRTVCGSHGIFVVADALASEVDLLHAPFEMLVLPGGMPGSTNLDESEQVDRFVGAAVEADAFLCAICAAPLVLGHRGLLMDRRATCYPGFEDALLGAQTVADGVVRDEQCITASGMGLAEAFGLELVAALKGEDTARDLARAIAPYRKGMKSKWGN